jgi:hypothetical protein
MSAYMPPVDRSALLSALRDVQDACPNHPYWSHTDDGAVCWVGPENLYIPFDATDTVWIASLTNDSERRCDAVDLASHACMYWRRLFEATTDNQTLALNYWFKFSAWKRLLDILDPMRESAERR